MNRNKNLKNRTIKILSALAIFLAAVVVYMPTESHAVRVSLKRIIFEGRARSQVITIINNTTEEQTYRLGWKNFKMTEHTMLADLSEGQDSGIKTAEKYLRYAPRRVTIAPGQSQQVRIMARIPKNLEEGEYRSHLWIAPEVKPTKFSPEELRRAKTEPVVKITMLTGLSLPVFVRHGALQATASFSDVAVTRGGEGFNVKLVLNREGDRSLYGDMDFTCLGGGGQPKVVKQSLGIAVYTETKRRFLEYDVPFPEGGSAACPQLRIDYIADFDDPQHKGGVMATATVTP